ncbi:MAG: hypothetical protein M3333_06680 [Actinomycetota bacterium]|nr:hypothetical protein [Actinomycetota bacterium]
MDVMFTVVLLILFVVTFVPAVRHARKGNEPFDGEALGGRTRAMRRSDPGGRWILMPQSPELVRRARMRRAVQFRKRLLLGLVALVLTTGVAAVWLGPAALAGQIVADLLLAGYVTYLVGSKEMRNQERAVVHPLPAARSSEKLGEAASSAR